VVCNLEEVHIHLGVTTPQLLTGKAELCDKLPAGATVASSAGTEVGTLSFEETPISEDAASVLFRPAKVFGAFGTGPEMVLSPVSSECS